jgi:hypothetical protein
MRALLAILGTLAIGTSASAVEISTTGEPDAEVVAKAQESASELADSLRAVESSLSVAPPMSTGGEVLSKEEYQARVEAGMKQQLAGLANELDQLSAALAAGSDPGTIKALLQSARRRAGTISMLGAGPSQGAIPSEIQAEMLTLWGDVEALAGKRRAVSDVAVESPEIEGAP